MSQAYLFTGGGTYIRLEQVDPDGSYLLGTVHLNGIAHHVNAIRVTDEGDYDGTSEDWQSMLDDFYHSYEQPWQTVELDGFPGKYVILIHPHGD